jgi:hypothetical protein
MVREKDVVVVAASDVALFEYLERRFKDVPGVAVVLERRSAPRPNGASPMRSVCLSQGVTVVRAHDTVMQGGDMNDQEIVEDRVRVDRWLEESQYLMGRLIPGFLNDRDRLRVRLTNTEQELDHARTELEAMHRKVAALQEELQHYRDERAGAAEAFASVLGQLGELQKPLIEIHRRLQAGQPSMASAVPA